MDDQDALQVGLIENLQRADLTAIDEAQAYRRLVEDFKQSHDEIAKTVGKSRPHVANTVRLLELPGAVHEMIRKGQLSAGQARALVGLPDPLVMAERALQDIKQPTVVQLRKVDGEIGMAGGEATHLVAETGVYDSVGEHMELSDNVRIKNGRFTVFLRSARFDFKSGVYGSDEPIEVKGGEGTTIFADRGSALNHGQELTFEGHVRTNIVPQSNQEPASEVKRTNP